MMWRLTLLILVLCSQTADAQRIISLAPHLTEWVYALEQQDNLVAVSAYSDYPVQAKQKEIVADYNGVDFERILALQPDLILAWQGGNKPQDITKLKQLGFNVFESNPRNVEDIATEIRVLGQQLQVAKAEQIAGQFEHQLALIKQRYRHAPPRKVFYYLWQQPLTTINQSAWPAKLLRHCQVENIFADSMTEYPQITLDEVIARQPEIIVAALDISSSSVEQFWAPWHKALGLSEQAIYVFNPDILHRFTPRMLAGLAQLCERLHSSAPTP